MHHFTAKFQPTANLAFLGLNLQPILKFWVSPKAILGPDVQHLAGNFEHVLELVLCEYRFCCHSIR